MKRDSMVSKALSVLLSCLLAGCASYAATTAKLNPSGPNVTKGLEGDLAVYVEEFATPEKGERAFDTNMAKEGVLPLLILVENKGQAPFEIKTADILVRGSSPLKALSPEEAAGKASRSAVGRAIGWGLIVPIIAIPIAVAASATHTSKVNQQMVHDFKTKALQDGALMPNKELSGFLYFELGEDRKDLAGLNLTMTAKNTVTGGVSTVTVPLPVGDFTVKKKDDAKGLYEDSPEKQLMKGEQPSEQAKAESTKKAPATAVPISGTSKAGSTAPQVQPGQAPVSVAKVEPSPVPLGPAGPFAHIAGTWSGTIDGPESRAGWPDYTVTMTIKEDGSYKGNTSYQNFGGTMQFAGDRVRFKAVAGFAMRHQTVALTLGEQGGKRTLKGASEDGLTQWTLTQLP